MSSNKLRGRIGGRKVIACGFGTGLAWGALYFEPEDDILISEIVHYVE